MIVIFVGPVAVARDAKELFSGYEFIYKAAKTPDVERPVHFSLENKLWGAEPTWGERLLGRAVKEVGCSLSVIVYSKHGNRKSLPPPMSDNLT